MEDIMLQWLTIDNTSPDEVLWLASRVKGPPLGHHIGIVRTMSDGRWLVLKHQAIGERWESYMILTRPP